MKAWETWWTRCAITDDRWCSVLTGKVGRWTAGYPPQRGPWPLDQHRHRIGWCDHRWLLFQFVQLQSRAWRNHIHVRRRDSCLLARLCSSFCGGYSTLRRENQSSSSALSTQPEKDHPFHHGIAVYRYEEDSTAESPDHSSTAR